MNRIVNASRKKVTDVIHALDEAQLPGRDCQAFLSAKASYFATFQNVDVDEAGEVVGAAPVAAAKTWKFQAVQLTYNNATSDEWRSADERVLGNLFERFHSYLARLGWRRCRRPPVWGAVADCCCGRGGGGRFGCPNAAGDGCVGCCGGRKVVERDCGTGDPYRGSGRRPWVNRVLCGVLDRGGVLERVKSEGSAGGGGFSTAGAGINSAYCHLSGWGCLLAAEVMVGGVTVSCGGVDGSGEVLPAVTAFGAANEG